MGMPRHFTDMYVLCVCVCFESCDKEMPRCCAGARQTMSHGRASCKAARVLDFDRTFVLAAEMGVT